ncbi:hypothetical protein D9M71_523530 [compost metagenome]
MSINSTWAERAASSSHFRSRSTQRKYVLVLDVPVAMMNPSPASGSLAGSSAASRMLAALLARAKLLPESVLTAIATGASTYR